jgi:broad specificity phosphatase PhoE
MRAQVLAGKSSPDADVHRRWLPSDTTVVNAWISGEHDAAGETWQEFQQRIVSTRARFESAQRNDNIIVFTSATPVAIWTGLAFGVTDARLMQLAGVLHNSSFTIIQTRDDLLRLFTFNATPHLPTPDLRTFR